MELKFNDKYLDTFNENKLNFVLKLNGIKDMRSGGKKG